MIAPTIRLYLYFAQDNDRAVILRSGPSKVYRLILWHRDADRFEDGQWLRHKVYPERCELSPDGRHFIYFALNGNWEGETRGSYTAISRPPYFTAVALFPVGDTWSGGGQFIDNRTYIADGDDTIIGRDSGLKRVPKSVLPRQRRPYGPHNTDHPDYSWDGGRLYRRRGDRLKLIRDFSDMKFEQIRAPYV